MTQYFWQYSVYGLSYVNCLGSYQHLVKNPCIASLEVAYTVGLCDFALNFTFASLKCRYLRSSQAATAKSHQKKLPYVRGRESQTCANVRTVKAYIMYSTLTKKNFRHNI